MSVLTVMRLELPFCFSSSSRSAASLTSDFSRTILRSRACGRRRSTCPDETASGHHGDLLLGLLLQVPDPSGLVEMRRLKPTREISVDAPFTPIYFQYTAYTTSPQPNPFRCWKRFQTPEETYVDDQSYLEICIIPGSPCVRCLTSGRTPRTGDGSILDRNGNRRKRRERPRRDRPPRKRGDWPQIHSGHKC